jgi:hypothetical protein
LFHPYLAPLGGLYIFPGIDHFLTAPRYGNKRYQTLFVAKPGRYKNADFLAIPKSWPLSLHILHILSYLLSFSIISTLSNIMKLSNVLFLRALLFFALGIVSLAAVTRLPEPPVPKASEESEMLLDKADPKYLMREEWTWKPPLSAVSRFLLFFLIYTHVDPQPAAVSRFLFFLF